MKNTNTTFLSFRNKWFILLLIFVFNSNAVYSQRTEQENDTTLVRANALTNVPCNPNTFWLIYNNPINGLNYIIREYIFNNNIITPSSIITNTNTYASLAYCRDFSTSNSSTFYNVDSFSSTSSILKFNGLTWDTILTNLNNINLCNIGGHNNILAMQARDSSFYFKKVALFNGVSTSIIYNCDTNYSLTAFDLAIDANDLIWFFEAHDSNNDIPTHLIAIDTLGQLVKKIPLNFNCNFYGSYGMFILNNKIYVGVTYPNPLFSNCLIPFSIINDTVYQETPILLVAPATRLDLESCNQGTLTSVSEVPESLKELSVYPNPAGNQFTVHLPYGSNRNAQLTIYNLQGKLIETKKASDTSPINCSSWPRGIYFVSLEEEGKARVTKKIVVI